GPPWRGGWPVGRDELGCRFRCRSRDAHPDALRLSSRRRSRQRGAGAPSGIVGRPSGRARRPSVPRRRFGLLQPAGTAGHRRGRAPGRAIRPRGCGRQRAVRQLDPGRLAVVFRAAFDCLWCGASHVVRSPDDLEGYAQLCPACIGRADENGFLRFRLKSALAERAARVGQPSALPAIVAEPPVGDLSEEMKAYYAARAPEYDDWYLRTGRYSRGPVHNLAWNADLDTATLWLDELPIQGEIVELAAGTGWWSTLLAGKGVLSLYDANELPLDRDRARLLAPGLRAHIHVRDAWA